MPAAASTWFASSASSAMKTAMKSNTTSSPRESDDASSPSFIDSLQAATQNTKPSSDSQKSEPKPASENKQESTKASAPRPQKKAARADKRNQSQTKESSDSDEQKTVADSEQAAQPQTEAAASTDVDAENQTQTDTQDIDSEVTVDTTLIALQTNTPAKLPEETTAADDAADQTAVESEESKKPEPLHLPWRHYHEKPALKNNPDESDPSDSQNTSTQAEAPAEILTDASNEPAVKNAQAKAPANDDASMQSATQQPIAQNDSQAQTDQPDTDEQNPQPQSDHAQSSPKVAKPKVQTQPRAQVPETPLHAAKEQKSENLSQSATQTAAATVAQPAPAASPEVDSSVKEVLQQFDATATLITDNHTQRESQPQTNAAASARSAQQTAQDSPNETYDQIVLGLKSKIDPKNTKAEIHLNPPELGALKVSVSISDGQLTAEFTAQNQMVRDLLSNNMERLRNVLEGQGVSVDRLAVQTAPNGEVASSQSSSQQQESRNAFDSQHDGRSNGNMGQSQQRMPQRQNSGEFAAMLGQEKPLDMVA